MRITQKEVEVLKNKLNELSCDAKLYLFGSRTDDAKKGGDIDLLIVSDELNRQSIRSIRLEFFKHFGEQKLDIVLDDGKFLNPFNRHIFKKAILL